MIGLLALVVPVLLCWADCTTALNVILAGGTGPVGRALAPRLKDHSVTILARNAFLATAPSRVTEQFGYFGSDDVLRRNPHVRLRDWDGGDLLDIVGQDWIGWQGDCLPQADVIVHLTGGYSEQRIMACERLIRESYTYNKPNMKALHVTVNPIDEDMATLSPLVSVSIKKQRIEQCESMVQSNCPNHKCLRVETNRLDQLCDQIEQTIESWAKEKASGVA